jgi:squalene-hopene/tetraprenyl-beta-curcumene cyclase
MSQEWIEFAKREEQRPAPVAEARGEIAAAVARASEYLLGIQKSDGFWCGELTSDTTLESDYVLLQLWLD